MTQWQEQERKHLNEHQKTAIVGKRRKDGKYPVSFVLPSRQLKTLLHPKS